MTSIDIQEETFSAHHHSLPTQKIDPIIKNYTDEFYSQVRSYVRFSLLFLGCILLESFLLVTCYASLAKTAFVAAALGLLFLTLFLYFTLKIYYKTAKPESLKKIQNHFAEECKRILLHTGGTRKHHLKMAEACAKFASLLKGKEYTFYRPPKALKFLDTLFERASFYLFWQDFLEMREGLLLQAAAEYIALVKLEPTNLEMHASLANAYITLASLYREHRKNEEEDFFLLNESVSNHLEEKFRQASKLAIEEFKILNEYAPDDPWIHTQLAYSYHDLEMPLEVIREYEAILSLIPGDKETLYKLGSLYFEQGFNAKGLKIYEKLKQMNYKKAESLILLYGAAK